MLPSPRKTTLLVVQDDHALRELYRATLIAAGYAVVAVEDGIDAIVLDVRMPRRSGLELLEFIRLDKNLHGFPVLILTGASLTPDEEATIARDSAYVFYKSENLESLALQLNNLTG